MNTDQYGCTFWRKDAPGNDCSTQWSPSKSSFMINFRVENLTELLEALKREGVTTLGEIEECDYGKFGWTLDPNGNKLELWEPNERAFL